MKKLARIAGGLYLVNIVAGGFAIGVVSAVLVVPGNAVATAQNIQAHELLYRFGLVAHIITDLTNVPLAVIFYELFKVVDRRLALLDVFFILVATAVESAGLLNQFAPLLLLHGGQYASVLSTQQLQALAYLPIDSQTISYSISTVFFGFDILTIGYLVFRSGFLPRTVGMLLALDGLSYLVYSFANLLAPDFASHLVPWVQLPTVLGEGSFCVTLLVIGVNLPRWKERAAAAATAPNGLAA